MKTMSPFKWRGHVVTRIGIPLTLANARTSTACQGKTLGGGVIVDCARRVGGAHPMGDDDWWLHLYVMMSRATRLDDLLLLRARGVEFLKRWPQRISETGLPSLTDVSGAARRRQSNLSRSSSSSASCMMRRSDVPRSSRRLFLVRAARPPCPLSHNFSGACGSAVAPMWVIFIQHA